MLLRPGDLPPQPPAWHALRPACLPWRWPSSINPETRARVRSSGFETLYDTVKGVSGGSVRGSLRLLARSLWMTWWYGSSIVASGTQASPAFECAEEFLFRFPTWTPRPPSACSVTRCPRFLRREEVISQERLELLLSWRHSGFSVHNEVRLLAGDTKALEALVRYMIRPAVSLARLVLQPASDEVLYFPKVRWP